MARTKVTVRRLPVKTRRLPAWQANREYDKKKDNLFIKNKTNITRTKDCKHQKIMEK